MPIIRVAQPLTLFRPCAGSRLIYVALLWAHIFMKWTPKIQHPVAIVQKIQDKGDILPSCDAALSFREKSGLVITYFFVGQVGVVYIIYLDIGHAMQHNEHESFLSFLKACLATHKLHSYGCRNFANKKHMCRASARDTQTRPRNIPIAGYSKGAQRLCRRAPKHALTNKTRLP